MLTALIRLVTTTPRGTWTLLVTHPEITGPGVVLLAGAMVIVGRKRVHI